MDKKTIDLLIQALKGMAVPKPKLVLVGPELRPFYELPS
jgi:hypothetical protein